MRKLFNWLYSIWEAFQASMVQNDQSRYMEGYERGIKLFQDPNMSQEQLEYIQKGYMLTFEWSDPYEFGLWDGLHGLPSAIYGGTHV